MSRPTIDLLPAPLKRLAARVDVPRFVFRASTIVLVFLYGIVVGAGAWFPYSILERGYRSLKEARREFKTALGIRPPWGFLFPALHPGKGVTKNEHGQVVPGLTLLTGFFGDDDELRLIRADGEVVRKWRARFYDYYPNPSHVPADAVPRTNWNASLHGALALPDGSVVFIFEHLGLVKLDRCGTVQWTIPRIIHHSVERAERGGFWVLARRYVEREGALPFVRPPYKEETIIRLSETGDIVQEISILDLVVGNLPGLFYGNAVPTVPDPTFLHVNDVEELGSDVADDFPQFAAGDLVLSVRGLSLLLVFEPTTLKVKWYQAGHWIRQHDPDFQPGGRISLFNNNGDENAPRPLFGGSTIMEVDPATNATRVRYGGTEAQRMFSEGRGKHQYLGSNGDHILITESTAGRAFEIDRNGRIVWEYVNRFSEREVAVIYQATRYPEGYFTVSNWSCQ